MNLNFKKYLILFLMLTFLFSCGNKGDKYIGKWQYEDRYGANIIEIKKAGNNMYSVNKEYCKFEDGCFIVYEDDHVVCCFNDGVFNCEGYLGKKIE